MRQVVLDTETTGLEVEEGHRILELGCVEVLDRRLTRRRFHSYINPQRVVDQGALEVHGITNEFLADKPTFGEVWPEFLEFVRGAELIIHNAEFDIAFLNYEMRELALTQAITDFCSVSDSLEIARNKHPGQKNSLNALCKRYNVDLSQRELHGALLDAELLADVYLLMTGGQVTLGLGEAGNEDGSGITPIRRLPANRPRLKVIRATPIELERHYQKLDDLEKSSQYGCLWKQLEMGL